jgi:hypothetical protein
MSSNRPNLSSYFRSRIEYHVYGMMASPSISPPRDVKTVNGDVTSNLITVTMNDGSVWLWSGGRWSSRKVSGCYAPLMPKPLSSI